MKAIAIGACLLGLVACEQKSPGSGAPTATPTASAEALSDAQIDTADVPVEEDFEAEAADQITAETLDDEVSKLEAEITAE